MINGIPWYRIIWLCVQQAMVGDFSGAIGWITMLRMEKNGDGEITMQEFQQLGFAHWSSFYFSN